MRKSSASGPGLVGRALRAFVGFGDEELEERLDDTFSPDATPYLERAAQLLRDYLRQAGEAADRRVAALKVLVARLEQLMVDLTSVGIAPDTVRPLARALEEARKLLAAGSRDAADLDALARRLQQALEDLGEEPRPPSPPPPSRGDRAKGPFWK